MFITFIVIISHWKVADEDLVLVKIYLFYYFLKILHCGKDLWGKGLMFFHHLSSLYSVNIGILVFSTFETFGFLHLVLAFCIFRHTLCILSFFRDRLYISFFRICKCINIHKCWMNWPSVSVSVVTHPAHCQTWLRNWPELQLCERKSAVQRGQPLRHNSHFIELQWAVWPRG